MLFQDNRQNNLDFLVVRTSFDDFGPAENYSPVEEVQVEEFVNGVPNKKATEQ